MKRVIPILLFAAALLIACHQKPRRVVFGLAVTLSNHAAAELAVAQINAQGGIKGIPVELMGLDWRVNGQFVPADVLRWGAKFADTPELLGVIGHSDSTSTLSAAALYNQRGVPQIVTIATNPAITNIGVWTYRLCLSDAAQGPALAEYAVKEWGKKRAGVLYVNDSYGKGLDHRFEKRYADLGGKIVFSTMHRNILESDDREVIRSVLKRAKEAQDQPDLVVLFQRYDAAQWTISAMRETGMTADILGGDNLASPTWIRSIPELTEGLRVSQFFVVSPDNARALQFVRDFRQATGNDPDYGSAFAYDAVFLLRDAVLHGGFSRSGVRSYLERLSNGKITVEGAAGPFIFGADHDARRSFHIMEVRKGTLHLLKSIDVH